MVEKLGTSTEEQFLASYCFFPVRMLGGTEWNALNILEILETPTFSC